MSNKKPGMQDLKGVRTPGTRPVGPFDMPLSGERLFRTQGCAECHSVYTSRAEDAKPISKWESVRDPIALAEAMWNHSTNMRAAFEDRKIRWPELTGQELTDILVYVRNVPGKQFPS